MFQTSRQPVNFARNVLGYEKSFRGEILQRTAKNKQVKINIYLLVKHWYVMLYMLNNILNYGFLYFKLYQNQSY